MKMLDPEEQKMILEQLTQDLIKHSKNQSESLKSLLELDFCLAQSYLESLATDERVDFNYRLKIVRALIDRETHEFLLHLREALSPGFHVVIDSHFRKLEENAKKNNQVL